MCNFCCTFAPGWVHQTNRSQIVISSENEILKSQNVISSWGGTRKLPYAFTENGIAMLSSYLIGASLKDLGKKWFGFVKLEQTTDELLSKM